MGLKLQISFIVLAFLVFAMADAVPNPAPGLLGSASLDKRGILDPVAQPVKRITTTLLNSLGGR
ncbi:hypothetical protein Anas_14319 [Armadillidium nasatum]|uniref:Uncharacterized protein n=1 Tax=Armadillidium nasatum TaxID=96803 RepID=A0A5N5TEJ7_9CRUS|nr:hypothetical protein Anas_14319 [Armadillidium nasatum]